MSENVLKILLIEDSETDADLLIRFLKKEHFECSISRVWTKDSFVNALKEDNIDIIIADHSLPQFSGMDAFRIAKKGNKKIPFILVTGTVTEIILAEYAKEGIDDYILKENLLRLPSAIEHVMGKKKIEILNLKLEFAQKHIQDSINYAKSIQNSMLADTKLLSDDFSESFIIFKPKDILSGDFYWFKKDEHLFFAAAADCTGHGIPGALMSMIGMEKLNNIVLTTKEPAEILINLNKSLEEALRQSTQFKHSQDGMDIALCCINKETGSMKYSGANRPLWIIRSGKTEIEEIPATHKALGGNTIGAFPVFENHEIKLQTGDTFFIFSDGYADQFGGEFDRRLTTKRFRELLINIQAQTMTQQETTIRNYMEDWKADREQIDDILVIGIRILSN